MNDKTDKPAAEGTPKKSNFKTTLLMVLLVIVVGASVYYQPEIDRVLTRIIPDEPVAKPEAEQRPTPEPQAQERAAIVAAPVPDPETYKQLVEKLANDVQELKTAKETLEKSLSETQKSLGEFESRLSIAEANAKQPEIAANATTQAVPATTETATPVTTEEAPAVADTALQTKIAELETKLTELTAANTKAEELALAVESLKTQLDTRTKEMEKLSEQVNADTKLSTYEQQEAWKSVSLLVAYDRFKTTLIAGKTFEEEYNELENAITDMPEARHALEKFKAYKKDGIADMATLKSHFSKHLEKALFTNEPKPEDGVWDRFSDNMISLVKVRKVGADRQGTDNEAILARAESALSQNNLSTALEEVAKLQSPVKEVYASWIESAKLREQSATMLDTLKSALVKPGEQLMFYER